MIMPNLCLAQDTAYKALRTVGASQGQQALRQIAMITGSGSEGKPTTWKVFILDPSAQSGIREFEVVNGQIASNKTPLESNAIGRHPIDLKSLNLDSDGAFRIIQKDSKNGDIHHASYTLAADSKGKPIWKFEVPGSSSKKSIFVEADTGNITSNSNWISKNALAETKSKTSTEEKTETPQKTPNKKTASTDVESSSPTSKTEASSKEKPKEKKDKEEHAESDVKSQKKAKTTEDEPTDENAKEKSDSTKEKETVENSKSKAKSALAKSSSPKSSSLPKPTPSTKTAETTKSTETVKVQTVQNTPPLDYRKVPQNTQNDGYISPSGERQGLGKRTVNSTKKVFRDIGNLFGGRRNRENTTNAPAQQQSQPSRRRQSDPPVKPIPE